MDRVGAWLTRFSRSKARLPLAIIMVVLGLGLLYGLNQIKNQAPEVVQAPSELSIYWNKVVNVNKELKSAESQFELGAGGGPVAGDYNDRIAPNNRERFVRATTRVLKQVEGLLFEVQVMETAVPQGAESHYGKLKFKLEERQRYYARLKDAVDLKNEGRWKEAFAAANIMRESNISEEQALNLLQAMVLRPTPPASKN